MKTKILLILFFLSTIAAFSQDSIFQLKNYKYRTSGFRALEVSISFNGNMNTTRISGFDALKQNSFQLYPSSVSYRRFFSTEKRWHNSGVSLSTSLVSNKAKGSLGTAKGRSFQGILDWETDDRFYRRNNWFFQLGNSLFVNGNYVNAQGIPTKNKTNQSNLNEALHIGIGKGRIESVQDAQMALFILNDLMQQGLLSTMPDAEQINEFAQLITEINNQRVFDFRRKRIYQLSSIDKFLREKAITPSTDIRHFTIINDNWTLALNPDRLSGSDWYVQLQPHVETGRSNQNSEDLTSKLIYEGRFSRIGAGPKAGYENYKPINLKWQRNMGASVSWHIQKNEQSDKNVLNGMAQENKIKFRQQVTELDIFYGLGFYPNNRTRVNAIADLTAGQSIYFSSTQKSETTIVPSINITADYFISYRTRINASLFVTYNYAHSRFNSLPDASTTHSLNSGFALSLLHAFL